MGRVIHTLRQDYISDDEHGRMSKEFKEHVKEVLTPLETTLVDSAARLEEHLKTSMDQHEKFVKDTHDSLVEVSEKFKDALTKQVRGMEQHIDKHEIMKESAEALAISTTKQFRRIILGEDTVDGSFDLEASKRAKKQQKLFGKGAGASQHRAHENPKGAVY
jgi:aromatic ring-opening dioxygenase catalytic subunit (LigB family)